VVLTVGYALLSIPGQPSWFFFFSLGLIAAGNGLFKANPNNLVSRVYEGDEAALDGAFTMYYMAINIGAFLSQAVCPKIAAGLGWYYAFGLCSVGLLFGIILFAFMRKNVAHVGSAPDFKPLQLGRLAAVLVGTVVIAALIGLIVQNLSLARLFVYLAGLFLLGLFGLLIAKGTKSERSGLIAVLLLTAQGILFFVFYQQMSTSLTLFALRNVDLNFYGYHWLPEQFQVLNPFWITLCSPLLAILYSRLGKKGKDPSVAVKFALGFVLLAVGFFLYGASGKFATGGLISSWWMIWGYLFQSVGELLISGLGLAMVSRYVGPNLRGLMMGAWLLASGIAQYLGSVVANFASVPDTVTDPLQTLGLYTHLFNVLGLVALAGTAVAFAMLPLMKKLDQGSKAGAAG
jgi:POT family proton-dependent oligopeptide transporter